MRCCEIMPWGARLQGFILQLWSQFRCDPGYCGKLWTNSIDVVIIAFIDVLVMSPDVVIITFVDVGAVKSPKIWAKITVTDQF